MCGVERILVKTSERGGENNMEKVTLVQKDWIKVAQNETLFPKMW